MAASVFDKEEDEAFESLVCGFGWVEVGEDSVTAG